MFKDCRGLNLTAASERAAGALDHAIDGYLGYRADMRVRMDALLAAYPDFGLAHCLNGYLFMMGFRADALDVARSSLSAARRCRGTERERAHGRRWRRGPTAIPKRPALSGTGSWKNARTISWPSASRIS
jgi:hypothetical protein